MSAKFLFVHERDTSSPSRPYGTSVRRHVRLHHSRDILERRHEELESRNHGPKNLHITTTRARKRPKLQKSAGSSPSKASDCAFADFKEAPAAPPPVPGFYVSPQIWELYPDAYQLIAFYLSGEGSQPHSTLHSSTQWSTAIIQKALESECHTLFLLCYVSSLMTYLNRKDGTTLEQAEDNSPLSEGSSNSSSSTGFFHDWQHVYSARSPEDSNAPHSPKSAPSPNFLQPSLSTSEHSRSSASPSPSALSSPQFSISSPSVIWPIRQDQGNPALEGKNDWISHHWTPSESEISSPAPSPTFAPSSSLSSDPVRLTQQAVAMLNSYLSAKLMSSSPCSLAECAFPAWCLARAAILQGDNFAASAHLQFLRHVINYADGAEGVSPWLLGIIHKVDLKLEDSASRDNLAGTQLGDLIIASEMRERMGVDVGSVDEPGKVAGSR